MTDIDLLTSESGGRLKFTKELHIENVSICFRFFYFAKNDKDNTFIYSMAQEDTFSTSTWKVIFSVTDWVLGYTPMRSLGLKNTWTRFLTDWPARTWNSVCWSLDMSSSKMTFVSNGDVVLEEVIKDTKPLPPDLLTNMFIMRTPEPYSSMFGMMADVNVWSSAMMVEKMRSWTLCKEGEDGGGDVVDWETAEWTTWQLQEVMVDTTEMCPDKMLEGRGKLVLLPPKRNFWGSLEICRRLRGTMAVTDSKDKGKEMLRLLRNAAAACPAVDTAADSYTGHVW